MADERAYLLDNRQPEAGRRFDAIAELFDAWTLQHVDRLGVTAGYHCWEVGAGGPGIARALAQRVGPTGRVLASDLDINWLTTLLTDTVEVRRHDITQDPLPDEQFDLVHARLVLVHLPDRAEVLRKLVSSVRPGGWLVIEDADPALQPLACPDEFGPNEELANRVRRSFRARLAERGVDLAFGRTLPRLLRAAGLTDVAAEAYSPITSRACRELEAATVRQLRGQLVGPDLSDADLDQHLANLRDTELDVTTAPLISCWGQRPAQSR
ncbi:SAM-dependent methyltransferase [Kitasatospora sp. GP30]|uniref:methyltransferase domain-containing protein n=1 Tax=Kitasatospora sp. GP30 TaxID=3035084 RepID=UPI000C713C1E|nr:methyltransferase domain-containing protein [Kitasatospora sp. GP30]MDH6144323.1 SAM-dependent methyltransferase [Kitasatospora sp. GP30]